MNGRIRAAIIAVLVVAQVAIGSTAAMRYATGHAVHLPPMPQRGTAKPSDVASMRQTALAQAQAWRTGAVLIEEISWLSWPMSTAKVDEPAPVNGWSTFVFASGGDCLAVVIDRGSGFVLGRHVQTLGLDASRTLTPASATISAETASAIGEILGGEAYRAACPDHRNLSKVGASLESSGQPVWAVTYADDRSASNPDIIVIVNASTGLVEQKSISMPPCVKA